MCPDVHTQKFWSCTLLPLLIEPTQAGAIQRAAGAIQRAAGAIRTPARRRLRQESIGYRHGLVCLPVTWPVMLLAILAIKIEDGGGAPVILRQRRVGLHGAVFSVMKFRSMATIAKSDGEARWAIANDARLTRVGQLIRKLHIDELPQIFNLLRGDMSLVGPHPERPEIVGELARKIPQVHTRHCVKPGITGWAQINYPYRASVADARNKFKSDLYYVKNQSLYLDFMVLLRTVKLALFGKRIQKQG
ncbi:MAG: sugar transferase [Halioglobus sp.]|nr:sugar transferase [Halioglobus sp.]